MQDYCERDEWPENVDCHGDLGRGAPEDLDEGTGGDAGAAGLAFMVDCEEAASSFMVVVGVGRGVMVVAEEGGVRVGGGASHCDGCMVTSCSQWCR